jgi:tRNA-guanine family transglycosylase
MAEDRSIKLIPVEYGFQNSKKLQIGFVPASGSSAAGAFGSTNTNKYVPADCRPEGSLGKQFVPAVLTGREEKALDWWSPNALFHYDSMLVSAYYGREIPNYREFYNIPRKEFTLYGDSGGFQNSTMSQGITNPGTFKPLNPLNVLRWQEVNCDVGFILDWPVSPNTPDNLIETFKVRTIENAELALAKWTNKDMKLYAVLHGRNREEITDMTKRYGDLGRFNGIALGSIVPKKSDYMYIAEISMLFAEAVQDYKLPIHFFGISGVNSLPIILYVAKKYKLKITFDSAAYGVGAQHRESWNPFNLSRNSLTYGNDPKTSIVPSTSPCDCPVCNVVGNDLLQMIKEGKNNSVVGSLICLHNLCVFNRYVKMLTAYAERDELLKSLTKNMCVETTSTALEFIDFSLENGIDAGHKKYFDEDPKPEEPKNSMFDF